MMASLLFKNNQHNEKAITTGRRFTRDVYFC